MDFSLEIVQKMTCKMTLKLRFKMKKILSTLLVIGILNFVALPSLAEVKPEVLPSATPKRVLFVGNSFSYYNNGIQNHLASLIKSADKWQAGESRYRLKTISGGKLFEHIAGIPPLLQNAKDRQYDVLVLQEYSNGPISKKYHQSFVDSSEAIATLIRQQNIQPVLFMTWAYKNVKDMTEQLANAYTTQGNKLNALVVPVGLAFAFANQHYPELELFIPDIDGFDDKGRTLYNEVLKHPSVAGTYLAACMFYASFYQQSPEGLSYDAGLDRAAAEALQKTAWLTYQQYYNKA